MLDPSKLISKVKLHLLQHSEEDIVAFGVLLGCSTEVFECFNAIFRFCSILSNHLAPSRDIAIQLADQEGLKHRLTGGWWPTADGETWAQAGFGVRDFLQKHPILQRLVGWSCPKDLVQGTAKLRPLVKGAATRTTVQLLKTAASSALNYGDYMPDSLWTECIYAISESLEECFLQSWVFFRSPLPTEVIPSEVNIGRITELYAPVDNPAVAIAIIEVFQVSAYRDEKFGMPVLTRRNGEITSIIVPFANVKFKFNAQHDCQEAKCAASGERPMMQERVASGKTENFIVHNPIDRYFVNMHAFHNAHLIRASLPQSLTKPVPLVTDCRELHDKLASQLREAHAKKAATSKEKQALKATQLATDGEASIDGAGEVGGATTAKNRGKRKGAPSEHAPKRRKKAQKALVVPASSLVAGRERRHVRASWKMRESNEDWHGHGDRLSSDYDDSETSASDSENSD